MMNRVKNAILIMAAVVLVLSAFPAVTFAAAEPVITEQPANAAVTAGQRLVLSVAAESGGGALTYQWFRTRDEVNRNSDDIQIIGNQAEFIPALNVDGIPILGATGRTFEPPTHEPGVQSYYVEVTSGETKVPSVAATVAVRPLQAVNILFVCGGNTGRSPMAKAITEEIFARAGVPAVIVSAGSDILPNDPAEENAVILLAERGLDLSGHIAVQWTPDMLNEADVILTATGSHRNRINVPTLGIYSNKLFLFREFVGDSGNVPDPFEEPMDVYIEVAGIITDAAEKLLRVISNAVQPEIGVVSGDISTSLRMSFRQPLAVFAVSPDGGELSYQWFISENGENSGGIVIPGATDNVYTPITFDRPGTYYYYAEVTNTNANIKAGVKVDANGRPYSITAVAVTDVITVHVAE